MSTRITLAIFDNKNFNVHLYDEMQDDAVHLEVYLKVTDGPTKGQNTHSYYNLIIGKEWVGPLVKLMER